MLLEMLALISEMPARIDFRMKANIISWYAGNKIFRNAGKYNFLNAVNSNYNMLNLPEIWQL